MFSNGNLQKGLKGVPKAHKKFLLRIVKICHQLRVFAAHPED